MLLSSLQIELYNYTKHIVTGQKTINKNKYIINPHTGTHVFGTIPLIENKSYTFPKGDIFLKYGEHRGANRGFGYRHIWKEHQQDIIEREYKSENEVELTAFYVTDILQPGAKIFCEFASHTHEKVTVLKNPVGIVVIEHRYDGNNETIYSILTAYKLKRPHGQLIGKL